MLRTYGTRGVPLFFLPIFCPAGTKGQNLIRTPIHQSPISNYQSPIFMRSRSLLTIFRTRYYVSYLRHERSALVFFTDILSRWDKRPKSYTDTNSPIHQSPITNSLAQSQTKRFKQFSIRDNTAGRNHIK